jgi:hypothetical protein
MSNPVTLPHGFVYDDNIYTIRQGAEHKTFRYILFTPIYRAVDSDDGLIPWNLFPVKTPAEQMLFASRHVPFPTTGHDYEATIYELRPYWRKWLAEEVEEWGMDPQDAQTYAPPQLYFERLSDLLAFVEECKRNLDHLKMPESA